MKEIVLDTETTGLEVKDGHRIVEIGCIELENQIPTTKKFHCYLNPERKVSEKAFQVHGYTDEFLSSQKKFKQISNDFLKFIEDKKLREKYGKNAREYAFNNYSIDMVIEKHLNIYKKFNEEKK